MKMRKIRFRGKLATSVGVYHDKGKWTFGYYFEVDKKSFITNEQGMPREIEAATMGQYTGLKDRLETPIYEGDIIHVQEFRNDHTAVVGWHEHGFFAAYHGIYKDVLGYIDCHRVTVIGNIHDNPELAKDGE